MIFLSTLKIIMKIVIILASILLITSCSTTSEIYKSDVPQNEVNNIVVFEPCCDLGIIESGSMIIPHKESNKKTSEHIKKFMKKYKKYFRVKEIIDLDSADVRFIKICDYSFFNLQNANKKKRDFASHPIIDSILAANNARFGLLIDYSGFFRTNGNINAETAKGIVAAALIGYGSIPIESNSVLHAIIIDSQNNNIAFYRNSHLKNSSPVNTRTIERHIIDIFDGYFPKIE